MATTTNYGWTTPDDTDLVKDGAAAIRTLGSSVDTTTKALNPSTTEGDIEYRSSTANTNSRLAIGTAGQVLTVNTGATAPEWVTPPAPGAATFVGVGVGKTATQAISNNTDTAVTFDTEDFDTDSFHSNVTNNSRLTIPSGKNGKYLLTGCLAWAGNANGLRAIKIYKNGVILIENSLFFGGSDGLTQPESFVFDLVATDYLEIFCRQSSGGNLNVNTPTKFQLTYLGA